MERSRLALTQRYQTPGDGTGSNVCGIPAGGDSRGDSRGDGPILDGIPDYPQRFSYLPQKLLSDN